MLEGMEERLFGAPRDQGSSEGPGGSVDASSEYEQQDMANWSWRITFSLQMQVQLLSGSWFHPLQILVHLSYRFRIHPTTDPSMDHVSIHLQNLFL